MSKSVLKILSEAYGFIGLCPNGVINGNRVKKGLQFANEVLQKYNEGCLFPFSFVTLRGRVCGGDTIIAPDADVFKGEVPAAISAVYLQRSNTDYVKLDKCAYSDIFAVRNGGSIPLWYSFDKSLTNEGVLTFDATGDYNIMVIYPKQLPELKENDTFFAPDIYEQVLKYGIAVRAAQDEGLPKDEQADAQKNLDDAVRIITESNGSKRPVKRLLNSRYDRHSYFTNPRI